MAEYSHDSTIGHWYFQAQVASDKLSRMTRNARAAHWNKPRGVRYRESADIGTTQTQDTEDTHQLFLSGVRVIQGAASPFPAKLGIETYKAADVHGGTWIGEPQLFFPRGIGLAPFIRRPVVTANMVGMEIEKTAPEPSSDTSEFRADYTFVNWFGGLDWGAASGSTPEGVTYDVNKLFFHEDWVRCVVARPIPQSHTGQEGPSDTTIGLRFRLIFGRTGGTYDSPFSVFSFNHPHGYYIHWQAMGPVAAY